MISIVLKSFGAKILTKYFNIGTIDKNTKEALSKIDEALEKMEEQDEQIPEEAEEDTEAPAEQDANN